MSQDVRWIEVGLEKPGKTKTGLAVALGRSNSVVTAILKGDRRLRVDEIPVIAEYLEVDPYEAIGIAESKASARPPPNATIGPNIDLGRSGERIPVYGQAIGGEDGRFVLNGNKIDDVLAPPMLCGVRDAYAVFIVGESMEPRYRAGETAYVHPRLPVRRGDYVVVQIRGAEGEPPSGYVKEFVSMDSVRLRLTQLNPSRNFEFPATEVISVHKIVLAG